MSDGEISLLLDFETNTREAGAPNLRKDALARLASIWLPFVDKINGTP